MGRIWSDENKYKQWLEVELAASEALAESGDVPSGSRASAASTRRLQTPLAFAEIEREVQVTT